jgi:hypothetical protein
MTNCRTNVAIPHEADPVPHALGVIARFQDRHYAVRTRASRRALSAEEIDEACVAVDVLRRASRAVPCGRHQIDPEVVVVFEKLVAGLVR